MMSLVIRGPDKPPVFLDSVGWSDHPCVVYIAINVKNGKTYVGATQKGMRTRKLKHFANAERGQDGKFYNSIRKHGRNAFKFLVLRECKDYWEALDFERQFIADFRPDYNLTDGGGGVKGLKMSDAAKLKMRLAKLGKPGHPCPDWIKKKMAELGKASKGIAKPSRWQPVECLDDGKIHESVKAAASYYGITSPEVSVSCTKNHRRGGYLFRRIRAGAENVQ